ncbi:lymphocyte antigen 6 complex locus protein G6d [Bombina bombina]|uniref:lymphocyte antigen 6 complex locus protein G6d n=1 Tax=Bombina bombina TaxID=8345 RepID=UPI00235A6FA4|nr:lymphocyte antigen 6 complex locus protein G6d [Bombina bombina]
MKTILIAAFAVLMNCQIGSALECYSCDYGTCLFPTTTTCGLLEVCATQTSGSDFLNLKKRGCINPLNCMKEYTESYGGVSVKTTASCCITNLCNSAVSPRMTLYTLILPLVALWLAKMA